MTEESKYCLDYYVLENLCKWYDKTTPELTIIPCCTFQSSSDSPINRQLPKIADCRRRSILETSIYRVTFIRTYVERFYHLAEV